MHKNNSFLTLTFDDKHFPKTGSVSLRDVQLFIKKLRFSVGHKIRFFACGEYSPEPNFRPHYHLLIFGHQFSDLKQFKKQKSYIIYTSQKLQKLWPYGFTTTGIINYQSAAYVARYSLKKIGGPMAADHYTRPHQLTGVLTRVEPEFITMSKKPGLGSTWLEHYEADCYPSDYLIVDGKKHPVPKFYDRILKLTDEKKLDRLKRVRKANANKHRADQTKERLAVREECQEARLKVLPRTLMEIPK